MSINAVLINILKYVTSGLLPQLISLFLLPFLITAITPSDYGVFGIIISTQTIIIVFGALQLQSIIIREYEEYNRNNKLKQFFLTTLNFSSLTGATLSFLLIVFLKLILLNQYTVNTNVLILVFFYFYVSLIETIPGSIIKAQERAGLFTKIQNISTVIQSTLSLILVLYFKLSYVGLILSYSIGGLFRTVFYFSELKFKYQFYINFEILKKSLKFSTGLIPHSLSGYLFTYSDKIILSFFGVNLTQIGLYTFGDKLASLLKLIINQSNNAILPKIYNTINGNFSSNEFQIVNYYAKPAYKIIFILCLTGILIDGILINLIFPLGYRNSENIVSLLLVGYFCRIFFVFNSTAFMLRKKSKELSTISLISGSTNLLLNLIYIPIYGITAAIYSTIFSFYLLTATSSFLIKKRYNLRYFSTFTIYLLPLLLIIIVLFENDVNNFLKVLIYLSLFILTFYEEFKNLYYSRNRKHS